MRSLGGTVVTTAPPPMAPMIHHHWRHHLHSHRQPDVGDEQIDDDERHEEEQADFECRLKLRYDKGGNEDAPIVGAGGRSHRVGPAAARHVEHHDRACINQPVERPKMSVLPAKSIATQKDAVGQDTPVSPPPSGSTGFRSSDRFCPWVDCRCPCLDSVHGG